SVRYHTCYTRRRLLIASSSLCLALSPSSLLLLLLLTTSARGLLHGRAMAGRTVLCYFLSSAHTRSPCLFRVGCRARGAKSTTKDDMKVHVSCMIPLLLRKTPRRDSLHNAHP
ncbi:unnamed protein product, partial [Ectocarpus sp. 12 AP-2014]